MSNNKDYFQKLLELMDILRGPDGCPWDKEQTRESLKPMLVEETYEVLEALGKDDSDELCEELGDLLFQIIFHSQISKEKGQFDIYDVCRRCYEKMVGRHPHVFGSTSYKDAGELLEQWEDIKNKERKASGRPTSRESLLDGVPEKLPALYESYQISSKAARVGFDWDSIEAVRDQLLEEFEELQLAIEGADMEKVKEEVGDLLFCALNISRHLRVDPETALSGANRKFTNRFRAMEKYFSERGKSLKEVDTQDMELVWQSQKASGDVNPA